MINDHIHYLERYHLPQAKAIMQFIAEHDCSQLPDGEMEILGRNLFVRIMSYVPKPAEENRFEAHQIHADLQYVVSGTELMQTARQEHLAPLTDYDPKRDFQFYKASQACADLVVGPREFVVFYPGEAHRPACMAPGHTGPVKKLVFKIKT